MSNTQRIATLLYIIVVIIACTSVQGCDKETKKGKELNMAMKTHYIGRFAIDVPVEMEVDGRTATFRYAEVKEIVWPKDATHEQSRSDEWNNFIAEIKKLKPPQGKNNVIIKMRDFEGVGRWAKGVYYYYDDFSDYDGRWVLLFDTGHIGVWFRGNSVVEKEKLNHFLETNIETSGKSYKPFINNKPNISLKEDWFYLEHGAIELPYEEQEESNAHFEGHPFNLVLDFKMDMDIGHYRATVGLIENTKEMLAAAKELSGGSMTKIRLQKRQVAGMNGEESILRIVDGEERTLQFTWEFNGKESSGEYPTTTIEMESPDGNLDEKTRIWDAILDSMRPMFVRKK